jgi:hypothetical protein
LNSTFVNDDYSVSESALRTSFLLAEFSDLINNINSVDKSALGIERESKLKETLYNELPNNFYGEEFACAGKICAVSFKYSADEKQTKFEELSAFSKNFSFFNHTKSENSEQVFKAIFIATKDPSKLSISNF